LGRADEHLGRKEKEARELDRRGRDVKEKLRATRSWISISHSFQLFKGKREGEVEVRIRARWKLKRSVKSS